MKEILISPLERATKPIDRLLDPIGFTEDLLQDLVIGKKDCNENANKKGGD